jgi:hypothetical protein
VTCEEAYDATLLRVGRQMKTPIFLLSSLPDDEAEADGYISKRVGMEVIVKRVQEILGVEELAN